jgi:hypothetical protein
MANETPSGLEPVRVLYVGGVGRSGSTLFDRMLGQLPGHTSLGEMAEHLWQRCLRDQWPCACGRPFPECPFWSEVGRKAFGGWDAVDLSETIGLQHQVDRTKYVPLLAAPRLAPAFHRRVQAYVELLSRVYAAVRDVSGAEVIVDSSKNPAPLYALRHAPGIDLRVVHLVRDPRGVAFSWSKRKERYAPGQVGDDRFMPTWSARTTARRWLTVNAMISGLARLGVPVLRVRYEDLIADPARELSRVCDLVGTPRGAGALDFLGDGEIELLPAHTAAGNPNRFRTGRTPLLADEAWRESMPEPNRRVVERITLPLRRFYGYR